MTSTRSIETLISRLFQDSESGRPGLHSVEEIGDAGGDVVADQAHAFDAVDAAFGGFVGVPVLEPGAGHGVDVGLASEGDHDVDIANELRINECGCVSGDVDADLGQGLSGQVVVPVPGFVPAEYTCTVSPAILLISPAAIWDLPPFLTQTNSTDGVGSVSDIRRRG